MTTREEASGFVARFLAACRRTPDAIAIEDLESGSRTRYAELLASAERMQGALAMLGIEAGAHVMIALPNGTPFVASLLAVLSSRALAVLASPGLRPRELAALLERARPAVVILGRDHAGVHAEALRAHAGRVLCVDGPAPDALDLETLAAAPLPLRPAEAEEASVRIFTYKGVGRPLAVDHSQHGLIHCVDGVLARIPPQGSGSVHLVLLPMYPVFGLTCTLMLPLCVGASILLGGVRSGNLLSLLEERRINLLCVIPDLLRLLLRQARAARAAQPGREYRLDPQMTLLAGGSYLDPELAIAFGAELGVPPVAQGYGATETLPVMVEDFYGPRYTGTLGRAMNGVLLRARRANGQLAQPGEAGELEIAGPTVVSGFVDEPELTARFFSDGWFRTGDLVRFDVAGNVEFLGRRLRFTKISGSMVDLAEVEAVAAALPGVRRARVVVRNEAHDSNRLVLYLDASRSEVLDERAVSRRLRELLSSHKVPRQVHVLRQEAV